MEREAAAALAQPELPEPARLILVPSARALAWFLAGRLTDAAEAATAAKWAARRLGFDRHFFAVDYLRVLAGLALERRDLNAAERLAERAVAITEAGRPIFEFLTLLDRARIWAARSQVREALTTVAAARRALAEPSAALRAQADELEAQIRLTLGDTRAAAELAAGVARRSPRPAAGPDRTGGGQPSGRARTPPAADAGQPDNPGPAGPADPAGGGGHRARRSHRRRHRGWRGAASPPGGVHQHTGQHGTPGDRIPGRARDPDAVRPIPGTGDHRGARRAGRPAEPRRVPPADRRTTDRGRAAHPELLPTSTYLQIAATLYISRNTVKTQLRSIYQKLGVASRSEAIERAVDLRLL